MSIRGRASRLGQPRIAGTVRPYPAAREGKSDPHLAEAIRGLLRWRPDLSARGPAPPWLLPVTIAICLGLSFGIVLEPLMTWGGFGLILVAPFALATTVRLLAALEVLRRPSVAIQPVLRPVTDEMLPTYTVLVPLYDEPEVLPGLVRGLAALDYPAHRLDLVLVLEMRDPATISAAARLTLPGNMRIVLVPAGGPKTKPKALNYALATARGELVVVFDAEDRPEPDQLRRAVAAFDRGGDNLACVQARLNVYNPDDGFFARDIMAQTPLELNP